MRASSQPSLRSLGDAGVPHRRQPELDGQDVPVAHVASVAIDPLGGEGGQELQGHHLHGSPHGSITPTLFPLEQGAEEV